MLTGTGIGAGLAIGPVARMGRAIPEPPDLPSFRTAAEERARAATALQATATELRRRGGIAGDPARDVLEAQAMMALDPSLAEAVGAHISAGRSAERALYEAFGEFRALLAGAGTYLAERVADLDDVRDRAIAACVGVPMPGIPDAHHPFVLVARDLAPADTALLDLAKVLAVVTAEGGPTSHTAILARARGIPAVVGCAGALALTDGTRVLVEAAQGTVLVEPAAAAVAAARQRADSRAAAAATATGPGRTADGHSIALLANIGSPDDAAAAIEAGAEGVGLYRTEFLYLDAKEPPGRERQIEAYRAVFRTFAGRPVVVRTLDPGADKPLAFLPAANEPNPALGVRGLRAFRTDPHVLDEQLAALAAAAAMDHAAQVKVMAPMVADAEDARWFVERARAHGLAEAGVMVEVPAAALTADAVLDVADFASIGTNDLTQYTLAADRMVAALAPRQDPWHPAVLALVAATAAAGARTGKPVGVCGEAAADPQLALVLVGLGVTSLSMAASALAAVRGELAIHSLADCRRMAELARAAGTAAAARTAATAASANRHSGEPGPGI